MTKYIKICLIAMIGIMFSNVADAGILNIWDGESAPLVMSKEKGELTCASAGWSDTQKSGMNCVVKYLKNAKKCFECSCPADTYPYTTSNCSGDKQFVMGQSTCTSNGIVHYKGCECIDDFADLDKDTMTCSCKAGYEYVDGKCMAKCQNGITRGSDGKCNVCNIEGAHYEGGDRDECVCDDHIRKEIVGNACVCKPSYDAVNGSCLDKCASGLTRDGNGKCTICTDSSKQYINGKCLTPCPTGVIRDSNDNCTKCNDSNATYNATTKTCDCNADYKLVNGACTLKGCSDYNSSYKTTVASTEVCTTVNPRSGLTCYHSCRRKTCSDYNTNYIPSEPIGKKCDVVPSNRVGGLPCYDNTTCINKTCADYNTSYTESQPEGMTCDIVPSGSVGGLTCYDNTSCKVVDTSTTPKVTCPIGASEKNGVCECDDPLKEIWTDEGTGDQSCECIDGYETDIFTGECTLKTNCDEGEIPHPESGACLEPGQINCEVIWSKCSEVTVPNMGSIDCNQYKGEGSMFIYEACKERTSKNGQTVYMVCEYGYPKVVCCGDNEVVNTTTEQCDCISGYEKVDGLCAKQKTSSSTGNSDPCAGSRDYNYCKCGQKGLTYCPTINSCATKCPTTSSGGPTGLQTTGGSANPNNGYNAITTEVTTVK